MICYLFYIILNILLQNDSKKFNVFCYFKTDKTDKTKKYEINTNKIYDWIVSINNTRKLRNLRRGGTRPTSLTPFNSLSFILTNNQNSETISELINILGLIDKELQAEIFKEYNLLIQNSIQSFNSKGPVKTLKENLDAFFKAETSTEKQNILNDINKILFIIQTKLLEHKTKQTQILIRLREFKKLITGKPSSSSVSSTSSIYKDIYDLFVEKQQEVELQLNADLLKSYIIETIPKKIDSLTGNILYSTTLFIQITASLVFLFFIIDFFSFEFEGGKLSKKYSNKTPNKTTKQTNNKTPNKTTKQTNNKTLNKTTKQTNNKTNKKTTKKT